MIGMYVRLVWSGAPIRNAANAFANDPNWPKAGAAGARGAGVELKQSARSEIQALRLEPVHAVAMDLGAPFEVCRLKVLLQVLT